VKQYAAVLLPLPEQSPVQHNQPDAQVSGGVRRIPRRIA